MKKTTLKTKCLLLLGLFALPTLAQQVPQYEANYTSLKGAKTVHQGQFSNVPSYIEFNKETQFGIEELPNWMISNIKFNPDMGFLLLKTETDKLGHIHYRYQQTFKGTPIEDAIWIAHTANNKVYAVNGLIYADITSTTSAILSESEALEIAKKFIGASTYKWELPGEEEHLKWESNDPNATYFPVAEMVHVPTNFKFEASKYRLAYKLDIYAHAPLYHADVYIDAETGKILRENLLIHHADEVGTAETAYSGEQEMTADSFDGAFRLRDGSRGDGVRTFDLNEGSDYGSAVDFMDDDNIWDNVNPQLDEYATDAHWGSQKTYDYYFLVHGRNSLDDAGFQLNSYVHYGVDFLNAFWDGLRMTYGDGDGGGVTPLTTLDIAGHEVTHGLTSNTANLIYAAESGALNESFSDIFGNAIERYARPDDYDWLMGEEIGLTLRSMSNPNLYGDPDTYFGDSWSDLDGGDSGGVHSNSGVQNYWFYLLTEGGSGTNDNGDAFSVTGLGIEAAEAIAFRNLTVYLSPSSGFEEARFYAIQAAEDLYGECSFEVEQTTNAWFAVGLGAPYSDEVVAAFDADETEGCSVPYTIEFINESINGTDYLWDFGDGTTSTAFEPSHTYTEEGEFTVTLSIDGIGCGVADTDISEVVSFITIDSDIACAIDFPSSGDGPLQTSCAGSLFDSGGADGDYGNNEDATLTIAPIGASSVEIEFTEFDIEFEDDCGYDYVRVYDGPTISSPLIGEYCNGSVPSGTIESSGPEITIRFHSDGFVEGAGFKVEWTCNSIDNSSIFENESAANISIFPNPSQGIVTITTSDLEAGNITVTDVLGRPITNRTITNDQTIIDFGTYEAKGVYLVYIRNENGTLIATKKVVIN